MARRPKPWFRSGRNAWFVCINGVQHNLGEDKEEAYERFYELMRQPKERKVSPRSLAAIIDAFLEWNQNNRSPETYEWYRYRLQRFIEKHPDLRADELRPFHVETWVSKYKLSVTSRRNYLRSVKRCMKWAKRQGYIDSNPVADLEVPAGEAKEVFVPQDEFDRLLTFCRDRTLEDLYVVTYECGCRPQESLRVTAKEVDLENHRWVFKKSASKGKRMSRVVYLSDEALAITKRLMLASPTGPLFRNSRGDAWTPDSVNCAVDRIQLRMADELMKANGETISDDDIVKFVKTLKPTKVSNGEEVKKTKAELRAEAKRKLRKKRAIELVPRYSLYSLRHSWATNALQKGIDPITVSVLMGHSDPSMLAKVYQHLSLNPKHLLDQMRKAAG